MALAAAPFAAQAETWNIYGWQNHSWEFVDEDKTDRSYDRIQSNAGNIGFAASMDAGNGISVNVQCEQFTYYNHFGGGTGWCNRNSKIGLSHADMGEIMFATWLLPYNEGVAQWVDPFYDAGADSHTSIMGSVGANTIFYNTGDFDIQASGDYGTKSANTPGAGFSGLEFNYAGDAYDTGFNRRQENIIQYWSPNWNGFVFRFAWTAGSRDEKTLSTGSEVDPVIRSSSLAYTNGPFWGAVTWQDHEDWTAAAISNDDGAVMESSDAESIRVAGRYIMDLGDGMSVQISAMWEDLEYEFNGVTSVEKAMAAFGYSNFGTSGNLMAGYEDLVAMTLTDAGTEKLKHKTLRRLYAEATGNVEAAPNVYSYTTADGTVTYGRAASDEVDGTADAQVTVTAYVAPTGGDTIREADDTAGNGMVNVPTHYDPDYDIDTASDADGYDANKAAAASLKTYLEAWGKAAEALRSSTDEADEAYVKNYDDFVASANADALPAAQEAYDARVAGDQMTKGQNVKIERDAWMVSGKIKFGGPIDFRFSYMDADDLEVSCGACSGDWSETAADAWNVGMFYTMPGGTELRLTYSEVDNDDNGTYGQGISGTGLGTPGEEIEMFAVGIVHWFD